MGGWGWLQRWQAGQIQEASWQLLRPFTKVEKNLGLKSHVPVEGMSYLVLPFASYVALTSVSLSFLVCKMGTVLISSL